MMHHIGGLGQGAFLGLCQLALSLDPGGPRDARDRAASWPEIHGREATEGVE